MKNERAGLVATAYIIGFTTAFIAFSISPALERDGHFNYQPDNLDFESSPLTYPFNSANSISAFTNADGLYARIGDHDRVLSAKVKSNADISPGTHVAVHGVTVSPDGRFIHFCEQPTDAFLQCSHYLYRVGSDSVVKVTLDSSQLISETESLSVSWSEDGNLHISDQLSSNNANAPWFVYTN